MRIPIAPIVAAVAMLAAAAYLFHASSPVKKLTLATPRLVRLADIPGTETEAAIAPDGAQCAVASGGDLWLLDMKNSSVQPLLKTPEKESSPSWTPDGQKLTYTRGSDT